MLQNFCEFSPDYTALLRRLKDPLNMRASERIIQFPYTVPVTEEKTEEEALAGVRVQQNIWATYDPRRALQRTDRRRDGVLQIDLT